MVVDNGYLNWGITIPSMKSTMYIAETIWFQWVESMRKDVECTFGILKGRFRILKAGIRCHGVKVVDKIWKTCRALHDMLLEVDGISGEWDGINFLFDFEFFSKVWDKCDAISHDECPPVVQFLNAMLDAFPRLETKPLGDGRVMIIRWS